MLNNFLLSYCVLRKMEKKTLAMVMGIICHTEKHHMNSKFRILLLFMYSDCVHVTRVHRRSADCEDFCYINV